MQRQVDRVELLPRQIGERLVEEGGEDLVVDLAGGRGGSAAEHLHVPARNPFGEFNDRAEFALPGGLLQRLLAAEPFAPFEGRAIGEQGAERVALVPEAGDSETTCFFDHWRVS
jgi:hypothetical protein